jgi:hypothetical protein
MKVLAILLLLMSLNVWGDVIIINNPAIPQKKLYRYEIQSIFMLKTLYWNNGIPITPVFVSFEDPLHLLFVSSILRITPYNFNVVVHDKIQQGDAKHVIVVKSMAEAIDVVKHVSGAVTYILSTDAAKNSDEIQIINITD